MGEAGEVSGEGVPIEPEDVVRVDGADCGADAVVEGYEAGVFCVQTRVLVGECGRGGGRGTRVGRFVERVVAGDPGVPFVVFGQLLPQPDDPVLEVAVLPE